MDAFLLFAAPGKHDALQLSMGSRALPGPAEISALVTDPSVVCNADLACAYVVTDTESRMPARADRLKAFTLGMNYDLAWLTVFGAPYVEMIGREKLLGAPVAQASLIGQSVALQPTRDPGEVADDFEEFDRTRRLTREHLGAEYFWNDGPVRTNSQATPDWDRLV